jgi:hypothetical protein
MKVKIFNVNANFEFVKQIGIDKAYQGISSLISFVTPLTKEQYIIFAICEDRIDDGKYLWRIEIWK